MENNMNEAELFAIISKKKKDVLLDLLKSAYAEMKSKQRANVFDDIIYETIATKKTIDEQKLLNEIKKFYKLSIDGHYYAPFDINSKNFMDIPEETDEWCNKTTLFFEETSRLTTLKKHKTAIKCFNMLFDLMDRVDSGDEIFFADEAGTWMVGADEKKALKSYIISLSKVATVAEFVEHTVPLLIRDSHNSFSNKVYIKIKNVAKKEQKNALDKAIKKQGIIGVKIVENGAR